MYLCSMHTFFNIFLWKCCICSLMLHVFCNTIKNQYYCNLILLALVLTDTLVDIDEKLLMWHWTTITQSLTDTSTDKDLPEVVMNTYSQHLFGEHGEEWTFNQKMVAEKECWMDVLVTTMDLGISGNDLMVSTKSAWYRGDVYSKQSNQFFFAKLIFLIKSHKIP